jgi:hypothetical protein
VKQLLSNTPEGSEWIEKNIRFKEVSFRRKITTGEQMRLNAGNK